VIAPPKPVHSLREADRARAIRAARTCYDHLAGALGVALMNALLDRRLLVRVNESVELTPRGERHFEVLGIDVGAARRARRPLARRCLDWSERRYHLAGSLGAALASQLFELRWIERAGSTRAVRVTPTGRTRLREEFGIEVPD
jgi:hypothetical protein